MKKDIKKYILCLVIFCVVLVTLLFFKLGNKKLSIDNYPVIHETKFGGVYIKMTIDDFNELGFKFGDSVDVKFSNGYELLDLPYYNGYYVDIDEALLIGYPGYDYIKVAVNYGDDLWLTAKLNENDTASVILNEKEKYLNIQNASDIHYPETQGDISDIVFANYRNVKVGNIKEGILYRSASPIDNSHNRASVVDRLISNDRIKYVVNLSDNEEDLVNHFNKEDFNSPYFKTLYDSKKYIALGMNMQIKEQSFKDGLVKGLTAISNNNGPYLVHCVEGKDRTGYFILILESLLGSSYQEMLDDYMKTYENYYGITKENDKEKYETIKVRNIDMMLHYIVGSDNIDLTKIDDYSLYTKNYLLSIGMKEEDINKLINRLKLE